METRIRKGRALQPGDTIGIVAPSGPVNLQRLEAGVARLESWGFRTLVGDAALERRGHLAGSDAARAADFNRMWQDPEVAGIICARGGYGAMRILPMIDWAAVRANPKFFCGFSDITALHAAIAQRTGLITFHGPMVAAFGDVAYNSAGLFAAMTGAAVGEIPWPPPDAPDAPTPTVIRPGVAEGRLAGGNLTLLTSLLGTPWEPDLSGRLLVLEEVDEEPYRVDRALTQLLLAGKLQGVRGIVFGDSSSCFQPSEGKTWTLMDVLEDRLGPLGVPILYGFPCGHTEYRATLPLGAMARLDAGAASLTLLEPGLESVVH